MKPEGDLQLTAQRLEIIHCIGARHAKHEDDVVRRRSEAKVPKALVDAVRIAALAQPRKVAVEVGGQPAGISLRAEIRARNRRRRLRSDLEGVASYLVRGESMLVRIERDVLQVDEKMLKCDPNAYLIAGDKIVERKSL